MATADPINLTAGALLLGERMREREHTDTEAGKLIGCHPSNVCKLRGGYRQPGRKVMHAIQVHYDVPVALWFESVQADAA
jgi:hypothetical protein